MRKEIVEGDRGREVMASNERVMVVTLLVQQAKRVTRGVCVFVCV